MKLKFQKWKLKFCLGCEGAFEFFGCRYSCWQNVQLLFVAAFIGHDLPYSRNTVKVLVGRSALQHIRVCQSFLNLLHLWHGKLFASVASVEKVSSLSACEFELAGQCEHYAAVLVALVVVAFSPHSNFRHKLRVP